MNPTPIKMDVADKELTIVWSDGHTSVHVYSFLRKNCPCAMCKGETGLFGKVYLPPTPQVIEDIKPQGFGQVGSYGASISWSDGHSTGVYTYSYLREICQCNDCKSESN